MTETVLINFLCPRHLKNRLDHYCDYRHLSKTSVILNTLETHLRNEERILNENPKNSFENHNHPVNPIFPSSW